MKRYYYANGNQRKGPFYLETLKQQPITPDTLIWYEGLADWQPASTIEELQGLWCGQTIAMGGFNTNDEASVPPLAQDMTYPPKSYLALSILVTLFCCLPLGIVAIINAAKVESEYNRGDIEEAKRHSKEAKRFAIISIVAGAIIAAFYVIITIITTAEAISSAI